MYDLIIQVAGQSFGLVMQSGITYGDCMEQADYINAAINIVATCTGV